MRLLRIFSTRDDQLIVAGLVTWLVAEIYVYAAALLVGRIGLAVVCAIIILILTAGIGGMYKLCRDAYIDGIARRLNGQPR